MKFSLKKSGTRHKSLLKYGSRLRPDRDWLVLLGTWLLLFLISVGYNVWLFSRVTKGESLDPNAASFEARPVDVSSMTATFDTRVAEQERYLGEYRFVDPAR